MKFGMPTLVECENAAECVALAKKFELDFVEINMSFPQYQPSEELIESLNELARIHNVFFTIHADEALSPFDFNKRVSECYFEVMRDTIRAAKRIGAPVINMHLQKGIYVTLPDKVILLTDVYFEEYLTRVKNFIKMCEDEIGNSGVVIAIENVDSNPFTESQIRALEYFMKSDVFALTLDTGHEMALDYKDEHVFRKYPEKLVHMHLHDCVGKSPHLPLGAGNIDVLSKISAFGGQTCLIEVKTIAGLEESVDFINKNYERKNNG